MKKRNTAFVAITAFALLLMAIQWNNGQKAPEFTDIEELRIYLKQQIAEGKMSMPEAQVRLAEAIANAKKGGNKKAKGKKFTENDLIKMVNEAVEKGDITEELAKTKLTAIKKRYTQKKAGKKSAEAKK